MYILFNREQIVDNISYQNVKVIIDTSKVDEI